MPDPIAFRVMNEIGIIDQLGTTLFERSMPCGLTLPQFVVLNHFVRTGSDRSPAELANALQVTKATMTSTLQRLEAKGFVTATPDPNDGRSKRIAITDHGRTARDQSIAAIADDLAAMEAEIGVPQMQAALPFLVALRSFLDRRRDG
ncbi:MAG: MarR family winged helix-turn-helix transcriptional regulator [Saprospiraceae bacterium]|jgi:DNA-binding MarR family transcriptional regulator